ncbi:regulatory protein RecX [Halobacteriovorax sp. HLS]|uniref:regulatory protein RecX n=1 Tax=Halobacteriovorax sp. HLS TaxID=2234000 RepID=UPI000FDAC51C|nr:regulatory protein RecX [Halobacteriovorax sp. HLS]
MKKVEESSQKSAYLYCIRLLAKRDYSIYKITKKLKERGYDGEHIEQAIQEVIDLGYLKEENYIEARVKGLMHKGLHPSFIQIKLQEEKIRVDVDYILDIFSQYPMSTCEQVDKLIKKKLPREIDFNHQDYETKQKIKQRVFRYLMSKGHSYSKIQSQFEIIISSNQ